ncbi:MAG: methionyl-tRNA formyltransferase [Cyanobacteria bacterium J06627_8]
MKIIYFGTPQFAVPTLETFIQHSEMAVSAVVTQPDKRRGRGKQLIPSPVKALALQHDIPVWQPHRIKKDPETLDQLRQCKADAFVVVAYGQILSQEILDMPRLGCVNGHGSILPYYRGAAPIQWCLHNGESETGITTMLMDAGMDTGPMLLTSTIPIHLPDNAHNLAHTLSNLTADLLIETLVGLDNETIRPQPQDNNRATYAPLISKDDYAIDWSRSAIALHNQIRGFYPNCTTVLRDQPLKIKASIPVEPSLIHTLETDYSEMDIDFKRLSESLMGKQDKPGVVIDILKNVGPVVSTGEGGLILIEVQLSGKKTQSGWDFANGTRLEIGEHLGSQS